MPDLQTADNCKAAFWNTDVKTHLCCQWRTFYFYFPDLINQEPLLRNFLIQTFNSTNELLASFPFVGKLFNLLFSPINCHFYFRHLTSLHLGVQEKPCFCMPVQQAAENGKAAFCKTYVKTHLYCQWRTFYFTFPDLINLETLLPKFLIQTFNKRTSCILSFCRRTVQSSFSPINCNFYYLYLISLHLEV